MNFLNQLNPEQKRAAEQVSGALLVLAGAGTGKTKVITSRICHMIFNAETPILPEKIVALSFTKKAATEMKERLCHLIGTENANKVYLSTFHSFALSILRDYGSYIGLQDNFQLCDERESENLLCESLKSLRLQELYSFNVAKQKIAHLKDNGYGILQQFSGGSIFDLALLKPLFENFNSRLLLQNSIEFDDIVYLCLKIFVQQPKILQEIQFRFTHFLVDEFQDTSVGQLNFIELLAKKHGNICVVGDDDQSIYSWRGANASSIQNFLSAFPSAKSVALEQNYRCSPTILMAANAIIEKNTSRQKKTLWSNNENIHKIGIYTSANPKEEAEFVAEKLAQIKLLNKDFEWKSFAVIYRSNAQSQEFENIFTAKNIPFEKNDDDDNFDTPEVRDVKNFLQLFAYPNKLEPLYKVVNLPQRNVTLKNLEQFTEKVSKTGVHPKLQQDLEICEGLREFYKLWFQYFSKIQMCESGTELSIVLYSFLKDINYEKEVRLRSSSMHIAQEKQKSIDRLLQVIAGFEKPIRGSILDEVVTRLCLPRTFPAWKNQEQNKVQLLTIHSSKGLEFPVVFLVGAEEGILPHEKSLEGQTVNAQNIGIQEERRLCYVAVTRAKQHLFISHCQERFRKGARHSNNSSGNADFSKISRFVQDIPAELLESIGNIESSEGARKAELSRKLFNMFR